MNKIPIHLELERGRGFKLYKSQEFIRAAALAVYILNCSPDTPALFIILLKSMDENFVEKC